MTNRLSAIALRLGLHEPLPDVEQQFEPLDQISGFDFPKLPIITDENPKDIELGKWWLQQPWESEFNTKYNALNTTIEKISKPNSNASKYQDNRCLVVVDGFYEWKWLDAKGKGKEKHHIKQSGRLMYMAGIYTNWNDPKEDKEVKTVSILTRPANPFMAEIHNIKKRMPVILDDDYAALWLAKDLSIEELGEDMDVFFNDLELESEVVESPAQGSLF